MLRVSIGAFRVEAGGIVALADLTTIATRCALTGGATWLDIFVLCPGIHLQQRAAELANQGELPPTAAMTSGYVFRTENQAMVGYLQRTGQAGHLSDAHVTLAKHEGRQNPFSAMSTIGVLSSLLYLAAVALTITTIVVMAVLFREWWTVGILLILCLARAMNTFVIRQRTVADWRGAPEEGYGDLIILLSQDRWVRLRGLVDDLKAVTSGQWMRDMTPIQSFISAAATLLVYGTAALSSNASVFGNVVLMVLLFTETALLAFSNQLADGLLLHDRVVRIEGEPKKYSRRLEMAKELINETGRDDWAVGLGMILPSEAKGVYPRFDPLVVPRRN
ncbi:hypothetical protein EV426DRAFT_638573 [Tirmania nivea]|nr:hypothetical protein EV426DRAFT_638573 [Tirmania nivea]